MEDRAVVNFGPEPGAVELREVPVPEPGPTELDILVETRPDFFDA